MEKEIKLKIVSDGTTNGTKIMDQDGNILPGVKRLVIIGDANQETVNVLVELHGELPMEIDANAKVIQPSKIVTI